MVTSRWDCSGHGEGYVIVSFLQLRKKQIEPALDPLLRSTDVAKGRRENDRMENYLFPSYRSGPRVMPRPSPWPPRPFYVPLLMLRVGGRVGNHTPQYRNTFKKRLILGTAPVRGKFTGHVKGITFSFILRFAIFVLNHLGPTVPKQTFIQAMLYDPSKQLETNLGVGATVACLGGAHTAHLYFLAPHKLEEQFTYPHVKHPVLHQFY